MKKLILGLIAVVGLAVSSVCCVRPVNYPATEEHLARGSHSYARPAGGDSLLVASYNIYLGQDMDLALNDLTDNPHLENLDILLLQEVDPVGVEQMARALKMDYVYWPSFEMWRTEQLFGNAILSKWPIVGQAAVNLPHANPMIGLERVAVAADIKVGSRDLRVVCVHLSTLTVDIEKRLDQVRTVIDSLANVDGPVIVGGDFNTVTRHDRVQVWRLMRQEGFGQARLPSGPTARSPITRIAPILLRLDSFFYRNLEAGNTGIDPTAVTSDHFPVWSVFSW